MSSGCALAAVRQHGATVSRRGMLASPSAYKDATRKRLNKQVARQQDRSGFSVRWLHTVAVEGQRDIERQSFVWAAADRSNATKTIKNR